MRRTKHSTDSHLFFDWLEAAADDLLAARILIEQSQCLGIAGFHCQQAIEKALKAFLIDSAGMLVDGHNLTWLCKQAARYDRTFFQWLDETAEMNRLYIETRYPGDIDLRLTDKRIQEIYTLARTITEHIMDALYDDTDIEED